MGLIDTAILGRSIGGRSTPKVVLTCAGFTPSVVEAGADREITVTARLDNRTVEDVRIEWAVTARLQRIGSWRGVTVPATRAITDSKTVTLPAEELPANGGIISLGVRQRGGFRQEDTCGALEVTAIQFDPDLVFVPEDVCVVTPREIDRPSQSVTYGASVQNRNDADARCEVAWYLAEAPSPPPVLAQTAPFRVPGGSFFAPPSITRRFDNPVADQNDVIANITSTQTFDVTAHAVNVVRA